MIVFFVLIIAVFLTYFIGISPSVYGGDSGDVILASWFGGVAHPPGYPLNTLIGWLFTHLPYSATVAFKANLMAALLQAIAVGLVFLIIEKLTKNIYVGITTALILAFNPLFWLYAHIIEVFQLNLVLVASAIYFLISWRESILLKKQKVLFLYLAFLFWGLSVFHHQTSILIAPAFFYLILKTNRKIFRERMLILKLFLFFSLGFIPYIFIPLAALRKTPLNWDDPVTIENFLRLITRNDYGTFLSAKIFIGASLKQRLLQVFSYLLFLKGDFSYIGLFLILIGAVYTFFKEKVLFWFVTFSVIFTGPLFLFYASFPNATNFLTGLWERFLLLSYFFIIIFLAFGIKFIFDKFTMEINFNTRFLRKRMITLVLGLVLLLYPFSLILINYTKADLSDFQLGDWLGHDYLTSSESNSMIFVIGDTISFNTQYIYYTTPKFQDRKFIKGGSLKFLEYREQIVRQYSNLNFPNNFLEEGNQNAAVVMVNLVKENMDDYPAYSVEFMPKIEGYRWISVGLLKKLVSNENFSSEMVMTLNEKAFSNFQYNNFGLNFGYAHFITDSIKEIYYTALVETADDYIANNLESASLKYLQDAINLFPNKKDAHIRFGNYYLKEGKCNEAKNSFELVSTIDKKDWLSLEMLSHIYTDCYNDTQTAEEYLEKSEELKSRLFKDSLDNF